LICINTDTLTTAKNNILPAQPGGSQMDNPALSLLFGSDIGILSMVTVLVALLIIVGLGIAFFIKSGRHQG
jgi:hypothetical protein